MLVLLTAQIAVVVYGLVQKDDIENFVQMSMIDAYANYGTTEENTKAIDQAQHSVSNLFGVYLVEFGLFLELLTSSCNNTSELTIISTIMSSSYVLSI